jgi:hypothetical protein
MQTTWLLSDDHVVTFSVLTKMIRDDKSLLENQPFMKAWKQSGKEFLSFADSVNTGNASGNFRGMGRSIDRIHEFILVVIHESVRDECSIYYGEELSWPNFASDVDYMSKILVFEYSNNVIHITPDNNFMFEKMGRAYKRKVS